jgi:hypothetical protein
MEFLSWQDQSRFPFLHQGHRGNDRLRVTVNRLRLPPSSAPQGVADARFTDVEYIAAFGFGAKPAGR